ncbi:MAG: hypothetical protein SGARI_000907 [Bacillariaceae sp.]
MSDLAPFVASVLRDEVVDNLKKENDAVKTENAKLQSKLDAALSRMIRITGPDIQDCELHVGTKEVIKLSSCEKLASLCYFDGCVTFSVDFPPRETEIEGGDRPEVFVMIEFGSSSMISEEVDFPTGSFPRYDGNEQDQYVVFQYVHFRSVPFDEEYPGMATQDETNKSYGL